VGTPKKQNTRRSFPAGRAGLSAAALLAVVCLVAQGFAAQGGAGAAAELKVLPPASGEVFVENRRGGVRVEVREAPEVSVSFEAERRPAGRRSRTPVVVERAENLLSIRVARATAADAGRVDLTVRVPPSARLTVRTTDGELIVEGAPAALAAQTVSGALRLSLPAPPDARVTAQSLNGTVALGAGVEAPGALPREVSGKFQAAWGGGSREVNLFSGRGRVEINARAERRAAGEAASGDAGAGGRPAPSLKAAPAAPGQAGGMSSATPPARAADDPQEVGEDEVIRVESDLVTLNFSVVERASGRGVRNLSASDFRLFEDNVEQRVEHFESAEAPFDLVLVLDLSGSTVRVTDIIRAAALRFVAATRPQDRVAVIAFAGESAVVSPLTADRRALRSAVERMARPEGGTRLYDSLASALDFAERHADPARRRAVVLMSDGLDSSLPNVVGEGSALAYAELLGRAREFDGVLYTVWTSTEYEAFSPEDVQPETFDLAHDRLAELAEAGGGLFYSIERLEDLAGAYERVVADLGTVYGLSYRPTNRLRDGSWRSIRVTLPRRPEAVARGRRGYFAK
jgi:Ca-activated chloride channel homolog